MPAQDNARHEVRQARPFTPERIAEAKKFLSIEVEVRPIPWAEGYAVSADGVVISSFRWKREPHRPYRQLKTMRHSGGYPQVNLRVNYEDNLVPVHRLVAELFLPEPTEEQTEIRHLNGDPTDNRADNLAWGTHSENMQDMVRHGRHFNPTSRKPR